MKKLLAFIILMTVSVFSYGQAVSTNGGSIQGTVTDPSGASIPGATVVISNPDTGYTHSLTTDSAGFYSLGPLIPGSYAINVSAPNFEHLRSLTVVRTGTVTNGNAKLIIGKTSETIEVDAGALLVNTDQISVSGIVTREQMDSLPVNGRNILDVAQLQPGVILQSGQSFDPTKAGYSAISVSGVGGRTTRILLDGQDITDETVGTTLFNVPSGPIQELQLNRSTQDVSGEVTSTGQVLVSTQSGTNTFHGNLFYNFQDNNAGFAEVNGVNAPFQRNQFGGYVGGPIIKDKLFFFGGAERIKQAEQDAAQIIAPFQAIAAQYPLVPAPFRDTYSTARLDYNGPRGIHFFVRGAYSVNADFATFGDTPYSVYQNRDNIPALVGGADLTTGRFTHSFRVGYEKFHNILNDGTASLGNSIYNPTTGPTNPITLVSGSGGFNAGPNYLAPQGTFQSDKQFRYDGTWSRGANNFKFGFSMNRILNGGFAEFFGATLFTAFTTTNLLPQCALASEGPGPCPGDPVNGYSAAAYQIGNGNSLFSERPGFGLTGGGDPSWRFGAYGGDTWKVSPSVTLSAGLRWSVDTDRANQDLPTPLCSSLSANLQFPGCTGNTPLFDQYQQGLGVRTHQPYANFSPQIGFVVSPGDHKMSLHGGIGIYYENDIFNNTGNSRTAVIQTPGAFFNSAPLNNGASQVVLPGYGPVSSINGIPLATIDSEAISVAAPLLNQLRATYQAAVQGATATNPSYIGGGGGLFANSIYAGPYKTPYSIQFNGGIQREITKGLIVSADYVHNATIKVPLSVDVNHDGAARTLNTAAAQNAIANTLAPNAAAGYAGYPMCPQGYSAAAINCAIANGATIQNFASNGLDSGAVLYGGQSASAAGLTPATGAAFPGVNPNVGEGLFILPVGRSGYDALQVVVQEQKSHPAPGIVSSNFQVSYSLSRIVSSLGRVGGTGKVSDQFFTSGSPWNYDDPNRYMGPNDLDHTNELSFGGTAEIKYGPQVGFVAHFYSAPPSSLTLDATQGSSGQIFQTDVYGDGSVASGNGYDQGDLLPGTNPGAYMRSIKAKDLNTVINNYNNKYAGQPTPAGQALINAGLFTQAQLVGLNGVQQQIAPAPANPLNNSAFRTFDFNASYPIKLGRFRQGLSIVPGVAIYNLFNMSNFTGITDGFGSLLNVADAGQPGYPNGEGGQAAKDSTRIQRNSGTFDAGGPRTTEFQLKVNF
jgi:hypothetical protein